MARETGGGGAEEGGARPACPREEDEGGAQMLAMEERGWPGGLARRWAGVEEREGGPRLGRKPKMGQSSKRISFRISIDFRIWQNFGKLHNEI
jgi:hypothetical protein